MRVIEETLKNCIQIWIMVSWLLSGILAWEMSIQNGITFIEVVITYDLIKKCIVLSLSMSACLVARGVVVCLIIGVLFRGLDWLVSRKEKK